MARRARCTYTYCGNISRSCYGVLVESLNDRMGVLILAIAFVIFAEALNSSLENLADAIIEDYNHKIKKAKDLGAAAVLRL